MQNEDEYRHDTFGTHLDKIISGPSNSLSNVVQLTSLPVRILVFDRAPCQKGSERGHREAKLHIITSVEIATSEIFAVLSFIHQHRIVSPTDTIVRWKFASPLCFVEEKRRTKHCSIIILATRVGKDRFSIERSRHKVAGRYITDGDEFEFKHRASSHV